MDVLRKETSSTYTPGARYSGMELPKVKAANRMGRAGGRTAGRSGPRALARTAGGRVVAAFRPRRPAGRLGAGRADRTGPARWPRPRSARPTVVIHRRSTP